MRSSEWRIVWDPLGDSPRVLLDYDDLMSDELAQSLAAAMDVGRPDFALSAVPISRKNVRREMAFSKVVSYESPEESWQGCAVELLATPWGQKMPLHVIARNQGERYFIATPISSSHRPTIGFGTPEAVHSWAFRVGPYSFIPTGPPVTIIGGWFNPPGEGIVIIIPGEDAVNPGDTVNVIGVPGVKDGYYPVGGTSNVGGNTNVSIPGADHNEPGQGNGGEVAGSSRNGSVTMRYNSCRIQFRNVGDGMSYQYRHNGGPWVNLGTVIGSTKLVDIGQISNTRSYTSWFNTSSVPPPPVPIPLDPLILDGQSRPNGSGINCGQAKEAGDTVILRRNGVEVDSQHIDPDWWATKTWLGSGPANHSINASGSILFTLNGNGADERDATGVSEPISSGTLTPVAGGAA